MMKNRKNQNKRKMAPAFVIALALALLCLAMSVIKTHTFNEAVHQAFLCRSGALFCRVCPEQGGNGYGGAQKQYFKTENTQMMMKMINPLLWLLERYRHPYYVIYTNFPGEIVYEDDYQVVVKVDENVVIEDVQKAWGPAIDPA